MANAFQTQVGGTHYQGFSPQPAEWLHRNKVPYLEACAIKYLLRWRAKNGKQDLEKARHYIDLLLAMEYPEEPKKKESKPMAKESPPAALPSPGEVWGVPDNRGSWKEVTSFQGGDVYYLIFGNATSVPLARWQSWLASSGAVRIDNLPARIKEAEGFLRVLHDKAPNAVWAESVREWLEGGGKAT